MSATRRQSPASDELLLAALGRRLAAVDDELPRLSQWRSDRIGAGQLHVVRGRIERLGSRAGSHAPGRARLDLAAVGIAAVVAIAVLASNRGPEVGRPGSIADASPPGPAFSFGPGGPTATPPAPPAPPSAAPPRRSDPPTASPRQPARGTADGPLGGPADAASISAVLARVSLRCGVVAQVALDPLGSGLIDKLAVTAAEQGGFFRGSFGFGWIGADPDLAARAFKGRSLLTDASGGVWILRGDGSTGVVIRLVPERARSGATAWRSADVLWPAATCPPPATDPKSLMTSRPPGDWPAGRVIDIQVVRSSQVTTGPRQAQ